MCACAQYICLCACLFACCLIVRGAPKHPSMHVCMDVCTHVYMHVWFMVACMLICVYSSTSVSVRARIASDHELELSRRVRLRHRPSGVSPRAMMRPLQSSMSTSSCATDAADARLRAEIDTRRCAEAEKGGMVRLEDPAAQKEVRRPSKRRTDRLHAQDLLQEQTAFGLEICDEQLGMLTPSVADCGTIEVREQLLEVSDGHEHIDGRHVVRGFLCGQPPSMPCRIFLS